MQSTEDQTLADARQTAFGLLLRLIAGSISEGEMRPPPLRDPVVFRIAGEFAWRTFLIGLALFAMPPFAMAPTTDQLTVAFIGVAIWCYYDGALACGSWPRAMLEAGAWFFCATKWTQALLLLFGASGNA